MADETGLRFGGLGASCAHLCVDMQRIFAERTDWYMPWAERVLPRIEGIAERHASRTVFTRFLPARTPAESPGAWRRYYERWETMTRERLDPAMVDLVPALRRFVPPAETLDKHVYSPWGGTSLHERLRGRGVDTLVVTGGETDVCVLATVLGAVDLGYRVVIATDALCSFSDESHDALLALYGNRYGQQVETAAAEEILDAWRDG